jgi:chromosome segregation ATPase
MTGEEMERAIEFLLKNQAGFDARLDRLADQVSETSKQVAEINGRLQMHAETQTEFIQIVIRTTEEQRQFNAEFRAGLRALSEAQARTDEQLNQTNEQLKRTDENLNRLTTTVQSLVEGRG